MLLSKLQSTARHRLALLLVAAVLSACSGEEETRTSPASNRSALTRSHVRLVTELQIQAGQEPPSGFVSTPDGVLFNFSADWTGEELWFSDGTPAGFHIVMDLSGVHSSSPRYRASLAAESLFVVNDAPHDILVSTRGTFSSTRRIQFEGFDLAPEEIAVDGQRAYFFSQDPREWEGPLVLFSLGADGEVRQELTLPPTAHGYFSGRAWGLTTAGGRLYFSYDETLWATSPTKDSAAAVAPLLSLRGMPVPVGERIAFPAEDSEGIELWLSDGTTAGTARVTTDINPGAGSSEPQSLAALGASVLFTAVDAEYVRRLYALDTVTGQRVKLAERVWPGTDGQTIIGTLNGVAYFVVEGSKVWRTDGTVAGTSPVYAPQGAQLLFAARICGERLFFGSSQDVGYGSATGVEPYVSDGTPEGTRLIAELRPGAEGIYPVHSGCLGPDYLFAEEYSGALWVSDGTAQGTRVLHSFERTRGGEPRRLTPLGDRLLFEGTTSSTVLMATDGGVPVEALAAGDVVPSELPLVVSGGKAYFGWISPNEGHELWATDGTSTGTVLAMDANPGPGSGHPGVPVAVDGGVVVAVRVTDSFEPRRLWRTDGTAEGSQELEVSVSVENEMLPFGEGAVFMGLDAEHGREPWFTDGTAVNTRPLVDFTPGTGSSMNVWDLQPVGQVVYFRAGSSWEGQPLWRTDGTPEGTYFVEQLPPDSTLVRGGSSLWVVSPSGVSVFRGGTASMPIQGLPSGFVVRVVPLGDLAILAIHPHEAKPEIWRTDGTPAGTFKLLEAKLGAGPNDTLVLDSDTRLVFAATTAESGSELWVTDGTVARTRRFTDVAPGPLPANPKHLVRMGDELFFGATNGFTGDELFAASMALVMDDQAPQLQLSNVAVEATGPDGAVATFSVTATDNLTPDPEIATSHASGSTFALGTTDVTASSSDEAGNHVEATFTVTVADTTAPQLACPAPVNVETEEQSARVEFPAATATDAVGPVSLSYSVQSGDYLARGDHEITVTAADGAGNSSTCRFEVKVGPPEDVSQSCGCATSNASSLAGFAGLVALLLRRRRRAPAHG